jgi:hypothetical protein
MEVIGLIQETGQPTGESPEQQKITASGSGMAGETTALTYSAMLSFVNRSESLKSLLLHHLLSERDTGFAEHTGRQATEAKLIEALHSGLLRSLRSQSQHRY